MATEEEEDMADITVSMINTIKTEVRMKKRNES